MEMDTKTLPWDALVFSRSESKALGFWGKLIDKLRDNSPRVVGALKLGIDVSFSLTGNPFMIASAVFAIAGRLVAIAWGTKENQEKMLERHKSDDPDAIAKTTAGKIIRPKEYPVESSSALSVVAEWFGTAYGVSRFQSGEAGYTPLILGLVAVWSYANILFGKEGKATKKPADDAGQDPLVFAQSQSKRVGWFGKLRALMKDNPVMVSSLVNVALCTAGVIGGLIEMHGAWYVTAFAIGIVANSVQALLVKKREFNIEGAIEDKMQDQPAGFARKLAEKRAGRDGDLGMAPA
jgi:hypothetical protein